MTALPLGQQRHDIDLGDGMRVIHVERWLDANAADVALRVLAERVVWRQERMPSGTPLPRLTAYWSDRPYTYAGVRHEPQPMPQWLDELRQSVGLMAWSSFTSCLGNMYRDGNDTVGWHADDEPDLAPDPVIASVSFGAPRRFCMRSTSAPRRTLQVLLGHGDLLIMGRGVQARWQHSIPRQRAVTEARISLTFRRMR